MRENSTNDDEVIEIITPMNNTRQSRNQHPANTTTLPSIGSFLHNDDTRNALVSILLQACCDWGVSLAYGSSTSWFNNYINNWFDAN